MKILHLISQHPESTGSAYYLQNMIHHAGLAGHHNALVAATSNGVRPLLDMIDSKYCRFLDFGPPPLTFSVPGMSDVMPYPSSRFGALAKSQIDVYQECWHDIILEAITQFNPHVIHSHHLWIMSSIARKVSADLSTPLVISCHSTDLRQFHNHPQLQARVLEGCSQAERIFALSEKQRQEITQLYRIPSEKIQIVGSGIDTSLFHCDTASGSDEAMQTRPLQLLYAGTLRFSKGVKWLLDTITLFAKEDIHLHMVGSGSGDEAIHCLRRANHLQDRGLVTVHGRLEQEDLAALMKQCHTFILPSFYEGLPLVLLEAVACGCRIITTDLPGCLEIVGSSKSVESGLVELVPLNRLATLDMPGDGDYELLKSRLYSALQREIAKIDTRDMASIKKEHAARQDILARSNWEQVFLRIEEIYRHVDVRKG